MAITITTKSSTDPDLDNRIYSCFEDRLPYTSWINPESVVNPTTANCSFPYFQFKATGSPAVLWEVISGKLPKGMTLDPLTGRAAGTPTKIGMYKFVLKVTAADGSTATKELEWQTKPYRGRWMSETLYAPIRQWSKANSPFTDGLTPPYNFFDTTSTPASSRKNGVNTRVRAWTDAGNVYHPGWDNHVNIDYEANAQYDYDMGIRYAEVCCGIDLGMFRMSPSPPEVTRFEDHAAVNHVKLYADAYHARGMKIGMYIAPNYLINLIPGETGSAAYALTDGNIPFGNLASVVRWYFTEWVKNKWLDVALIDVGAASDYYVDGFASAAAFPMQVYVPIFRFYNEDFCFCVNPGTRTGDCFMGGAQVHFPHADGYIFEQTKSSTTSEIAYEYGTPPMLRKKVFIYQWQVPSESFGYGPLSVGSIMKNIPGTKKAMSAGWENGCTFAAAHPVASTGEYPTPYFKDYFEQLAAHAAAAGGYSSFCEMDYEGGRVTITSAPDEVIYYTLDGTYPTKDSPVYMGSILITKPTHIRARSKKAGRLMGHVEDGFFGQDLESVSTGKLAFSIGSVKNVTMVTDPVNSFRGNKLFVFNKDIIVDAFGRQGTATIPHELIIKRLADEFNHGFLTLKPTDPVEAGYQWVDAHGLRLKAGSSYWIAFKEGTVDQFASNPMTENPVYNMDDYRIKGNAIGSPLGDLIPYNANFDWYNQWSVGGNYNIGQYINMKYRTVENGEPHVLNDFLLGRDAACLDNAGNPASINGGVRVATNGNNNLDHTYTAVGGIYAWTWAGYLEKPRWVNRVEVEFFNTGGSVTAGGFATQFSLYLTLNAFLSASTLISTKFDNKSLKVTFTFPKRFCNRVYIQATLPNAAGQLGGGMALKRVSAYLK